MSTTTRKYATIKHPTIEALVGGHYKYKEKKQALARFNSIAEYFVLSKEQPEANAEDPATIFWIKGFEVDEAAETAGFSGQFAEMRIKKLASGIFTLTAKKVERPLATHPQKKRPTSKHPNWGHPVMRAVKKKKKYGTIEEAQAELDLLHLEYPEVSIPGNGKLYIIIYEKREGIARPTHKIALEIQLDKEDSKFYISSRDNEKQAKPKIKPAAEAEAAPKAAKAAMAGEEAKPGYFANKVLLNKTKRRKNAGRPQTGMKPKDEAE